MTELLKLFIVLTGSAVLAACGGGGSSSSITPPVISGLALDNITTPSKIYVTNADKQVIQTVDFASNAVTTYAGVAGTFGSTDATGTAAKFYEPVGISLVGTDFYIADTFNHSIRKMTSAGVVTTLAGTSGTYGSVDGTGAEARFNSPKGITGNATYLYVADTYNHTIRQITLSSRLVATFAGSPGEVGTADGSGSVARFNYPFGVTLDNSGNLFVTDAVSHTIRKITSAGAVSTFAGVAGIPGSIDDTGTAAKFNFPAGIASDGTNLFVVDSGNHTIRKITSAGVVTTFAGTAGSTGSTDATGTAARFSNPTALTVDASGNLYVSDQNYTKIRKITSAGVVTTLNASF
jgi:hypothetical protein